MIFVINLLNGRDSINMLCIIRLKSEYYINSICSSALEKPGFRIRQIMIFFFLVLVAQIYIYVVLRGASKTFFIQGRLHFYFHHGQYHTRIARKCYKFFYKLTIHYKVDPADFVYSGRRILRGITADVWTAERVRFL